MKGLLLAALIAAFMLSSCVVGPGRRHGGAVVVPAPIVVVPGPGPGPDPWPGPGPGPGPGPWPR